RWESRASGPVRALVFFSPACFAGAAKYPNRSQAGRGKQTSRIQNRSTLTMKDTLLSVESSVPQRNFCGAKGDDGFELSNRSVVSVGRRIQLAQRRSIER
ncbi:hypothetical protein, partial [Roseiconus lacunae]